MPGVVQQYVEAVKEVENYASHYGQDWDVRNAYEENLRIERQSHPEETYGEAVNRAVEITKHEILESASISEERENTIRERAFSEGFSVTRSHLDEVYFNNKTSNGWDAYLGKSESWSIAEERELVRDLSVREIRFISLAQDTPDTRYATDEPYRLGAREAVRQFSHENNHRLKEAEQPRESNRESVRIQFG